MVWRSTEIFVALLCASCVSTAHAHIGRPGETTLAPELDDCVTDTADDILSLEFEPSVLKVFEHETDSVNVSYTFVNASEHWEFIQSNVFEVTVKAENVHVAVMHHNHTTFVLKDHIGAPSGDYFNQSYGQNTSFSVAGVRLGYGLFSLHIRVIPIANQLGELVAVSSDGKKSPSANCSLANSRDSRGNMTFTYREKYRVGVRRKPTTQDYVFMAIVLTLVIVSTISMGCAVDLAVVRDVLKKPIAPSIGLGSQFIIMPLLAFALCKILGFDGNAGLGFFASGCAPGGGSSNKYTYLVNGDVSLSVTMTLMSNLVSLGAIPMWLFTLGQTFTQEASTDVHIKIPFENILFSLLSILLTVAIGVFFKYKVPKVAKFLLKIVRPMLIVIIIFLFTFGLWANFYIFSLFTPGLIIAGMCLPWVGFLLGGLTAAIFRQSWTRIKTIAIETGIQNTGVPIMLLKFSLPEPDADIAMISIVAASMFTSMPLWVCVAYIEIRKRCCKKQESDEEDEEKTPEKVRENGDVEEKIELNAEKLQRLDRETNV